MKISWLPTVAGLAVVGTVIRAAFYTPLEAKQGAAQKIFYIHVPAAWVAFMAFGLVAIAMLAGCKQSPSRQGPVTQAEALRIVGEAEATFTSGDLGKIMDQYADDAVMISDDTLAGCDLWGTSVALAAAIKLQNADLVVTGTQSTDAISGDLPGMLAEKLGIPGLTYARTLEIADGRVRVQRETDNGYMTISAPLPALVSVTKSANEPRYPSLKGIMGAKKKEIKQLAAADLGLTVAVGTDGAKAQLTDLATPPARAKGQVLQAPDPAEGAKAIFAFLKERKFL